MKKLPILFLLVPFLCMAGGAMRSFEQFDTFFDESEFFYYANVQSSFDRGLGGIGVRYKDDGIGFDTSIALSLPQKSSTQLLDITASALFFPYTDYLYAGFGAGMLMEAKGKLVNKTYLKGTLGLEKRFDRAGNYFAEATLQAPTDFNPKKPAIAPGFRFGVGY